jgi:hypothetical protein
LVIAPRTADNWAQLLCAARELNGIHHGGATIVFDGTDCFAQCVDNFDTNHTHEIRSYPSTVKARAMKLLSALARMTNDFGQHISLTSTDYPLAYVDSPEKMAPYLHYLEQNGYLTIEAEAMNHEVSVSLTAAGLELAENGSVLSHKVVFISSTCRDLIDCRDELARYLRDNGYLVRMSDQSSTFELPADAGSLGSCLHNVERSDAVVAILDGRYGSRVTAGDFVGKSVTHAEIEHAIKMQIPVRAFIRRPAFADWESLKSDPANTPRWVEPNDEGCRRGWMDLMSTLSEHKNDGLQSRWIDQFNSVVDLKEIVAERLRSIPPNR